MYNLACKEVSWLFYSGEGGGQTVVRKGGAQKERRTNENERSDATSGWTGKQKPERQTSPPPQMHAQHIDHDKQHSAGGI
jgi:hypothetical protein